jgi:threonylcarbamoyladenosine tRNA methylthiotransferase MtaB
MDGFFVLTMEKKSKIAFVTLGCKLNFSETSTIARQFPESGYERVSPLKAADIYVINTCAVTLASERKCRQAIRRVAKLNPNAQVIVTGCYAQLRPHEINEFCKEVKGLTILMDKSLFYTPHTTLQEARPDNYCRPAPNSFFPAYSSGDRTRSFLKVQDGCDYHCTYCTVPLARGDSRNIPIKKLVDTARTIAEQGIKEIVITGVNVGDFGKSTGENFFDLLKALHDVEGIARYRISSIEPNLLTTEMLQWIAHASKILPHFHIPLQSGSNKILERMKRRYTRELFAQRMNEIRRLMPRAFIGVDVIVGFPGETAEDFEDTCHFLKELEPSFLHVFPYSARPDTLAAGFDEQVPEQEKTRRANALGKLSDALHLKFYEQNIGIEEQVLFEDANKGGKMFGYTRNYIKVETPYDPALSGQIIAVRTTGISASGNMGVILLRSS